MLEMYPEVCASREGVSISWIAQTNSPQASMRRKYEACVSKLRGNGTGGRVKLFMCSQTPHAVYTTMIISYFAIKVFGLRGETPSESIHPFLDRIWPPRGTLTTIWPLDSIVTSETLDAFATLKKSSHSAHDTTG